MKKITSIYPGYYPGYYPTKNFVKFCKAFIPVRGRPVTSVCMTFIPVPGTSVSSARPCHNTRNVCEFRKTSVPVYPEQLL